MIFYKTLLIALSCAITGSQSFWCAEPNEPAAVAGSRSGVPARTGEALDVVVSAAAVLAWDMESGEILYEKEANVRRPIASVNKLLAALIVRDCLQMDEIIAIPPEVVRSQRAGADVGLKPGDHMTVASLLQAGLVPSANDAMTALAVACAGDEDKFAIRMNEYAQSQGWLNTQAANATGLSGGEQYSSAADVRKIFEAAYDDLNLRKFLSMQTGEITSQEGSRIKFKSTNELLGTYLPVLAAKTGFTLDAKENLALISQTEDGHAVGIVILGSDHRFYDAKVMVEWLQRNYTWPDSTRMGG